MGQLNSDFRRLQRKKALTDARFLNIRYIAELTKFRIAPHHVVFHILKVLLEDFSHANIELIAQFLEACGRFLYASPDTTSQMSTTVSPHPTQPQHRILFFVSELMVAGNDATKNERHTFNATRTRHASKRILLL